MANCSCVLRDLKKKPWPGAWLEIAYMHLF